MFFDYATLKVIGWLCVGVLLLGFAMTDGVAMGVSQLLPWIGQTDDERRMMIHTVEPHWYANQAWLIAVGAVYLAIWPMAYAVASASCHGALWLVLLALSLRIVAFEYRHKIDDWRWRHLWDWGLFVGGVLPALMFGAVFGNLLQGLPFQLDHWLRIHDAGGFWSFFNPFALLAGVVSVSLLTMHGAVWLQWRTRGRLAGRAKSWTKAMAIVVMVTFAVAGLWVGFGLSGFRLLTHAPFDAQANPLTKTVGVSRGAWLDNYWRYPLAWLCPILGFAATGMAHWLAARDRPG